MNEKYLQLNKIIQNLITNLPKEWIDQLINSLSEYPKTEWSQFRSQITNIFPRTSIQRQVGEFLDYWHSETPEIQTSGLVLTLLTASEIENQFLQEEKIELVWTGPKSSVIPLRRTDQVLLQLINETENNLIIVSFAVYKIKSILNALVSALERGVSVNILIETPGESDNRIAFDTFQQFNSDIQEKAIFYIWPIDQRLQTSDGKSGSLHAKFAVSDSKKLFISSANLTEYALHLNMELGVLLTGGRLPTQVEGHFNELRLEGVIRRFKRI